MNRYQINNRHCPLVPKKKGFPSFDFESNRERPPQDLNRERPDELVVDFNASWAGNPDIVLAVTGKFVSGFGPSTFNVALTNLEFKGKFRATIKPLLDVLPVIGGAAVMMVQEPYIDYEVRACVCVCV